MNQGRLANVCARTALPLALCLSVFVTANYCMSFPRTAQGISSLWWTNGLPLAALLRTERRLWPYIIAASLVGNAASLIYFQNINLVILIYRIFSNALQYVLCAHILRIKFGNYFDITNIYQNIYLAAVGAVTTIAKIAYLFVGYAILKPGIVFTLPSILSWAPNNYLGLFVILYPILSITARPIFSERRIDGAGFLILAALVAVLYITFGPMALPGVFVAMPILMLLAWRHGLFGVGIGNLLTIIVSAGLTQSGVGIANKIGAASYGGFGALTRGSYLELFLSVAMFSSIPLAVARAKQQIVDLELEDALAASQHRAALLAESETALQTLEHRWRAALESSGLGVWDYNQAEGEMYLSKAWKSMRGYGADELDEDIKTLVDSTHPDDRHKFATVIGSATQSGSEPFEFEERIRCRDGHYKWIAVRGMVLERSDNGSPIRFIGTNIDIDEKRMAAFAAQRRASLYMALAACNDAIVRRASIKKLAGLICEALVNNAQIKLAWVGFANEKNGLIELYHAFGSGTDYLDGLIIPTGGGDQHGHGPTGLAFRLEQPVWVNDYMADPRTAPWHDRAKYYGWKGTAALPLRHEGKVAAVLTVYVDEVDFFDQETRALLRDIATQFSLALDTLSAEVAARHAQKRLRNIIETCSDVICTLDRQGRFLEVSENCEAIWGWPPASLLGRSCIDFMHPDDRESMARNYQHRVLGNPQRVPINRYLRPDGTAVPMSWSATWIEEDQVCHCIGRDMTEFHALEAQAQLAHRMDAIGQLTGGIAHDFNNLLTIIIGSSENLAEQLADPEQVELAEFILQAAEQGGELTKHLLAFARRQPLQPHPFDVNELLDRTMGLIKRTHGEDVELVLEQGPNLLPAFADPSQTESAILNLCLNARDAMPNGGRLKIRTENITLSLDETNLKPETRAGSYVAISVSDTGTGIAPDAIERIFEPFYTTKEVGKGSGLGLSMVYGFIRQSEGYIDLTSKVGEGTTFTLYLPTADADFTVLELPDQDEAAVNRGTENVLVVEDNDLVRKNAHNLFESLGYKVTLASSGHEALAIIKQQGDIDLLFTDIMMPGGMNGRELGEQATQLCPRLRVLYTSGYSQEALSEHGRLLGNVTLLQKPFSKRQLSRKARKVLDEVL